MPLARDPGQHCGALVGHARGRRGRLLLHRNAVAHMRCSTAGFILTRALGVLAAPVSSAAQQTAKVPRIGILTPGPISERLLLFEAFRQGLRDLGYVEGQTVTLEFRSAEGNFERLPDLAAELVRLKVDVIVAATTAASLAAKQATWTLPIVMAVTADPVGVGLVSSLARPGGNITGLDLLSVDLARKRLELLRETVPGLSRVAVLSSPTTPATALQMRETQVVAQALGVRLQALDVRGPNEFEGAFRAATRGRAGALLTLDDPFIFTHRTLILALVAKSRLPAMYGFREFAEAGGLMAYGTYLPALYRRAAVYVDKILKGAKPADLPVEQPTRFELVINLKTAKALGLTFPQSILIRADQVIQ